MQSSDIRIVIADDHQIVLEALELSLSKAGFNIVETAINPRLALEACLRHSANLFLTDLLMADENGLEAARKVRAKLPDCKVIVLTSSRSPWHLARAKHDGVDGYISKSAPIGSLVQAILRVVAGERIFDADLVSEATNVHNHLQTAGGKATLLPANNPLTDQEARVLKLISAGLSNVEIADLLDLSPHTIKAHVRHIFHKLEVSDRTTAAIWALQTGLVSTEETFPSIPLRGSH